MGMFQARSDDARNVGRYELRLSSPANETRERERPLNATTRFAVDSAVGAPALMTPSAVPRPRTIDTRSPRDPMGVPKRRVSHARQGERRSHLAIDLPDLEECPHCHEMKLPHRVCPNCGYYQGRLAVPPKPVSSSGDADR